MISKLFVILLTLIVIGAGLFFSSGCTNGDGNGESHDFVVFIADKDTDEQVELYMADLQGTAVTKLSSPLIAGGDVQLISLSPNLQYVAYAADQDVDEVIELYVAAIDGSDVVKVSGTMVSGGSIGSVWWAPDSSRLVYWADQDVDEAHEIYSVAPDGSGWVKLNDALITGRSVSSPQISPDSSRVVYRADQDSDDVTELYSVPLTGGTVTKLNGPLPTNGDVLNFAISLDGTRVIYMGDQDTNDIYELYSVPTTGGARVKLSGTITTTSISIRYEISADSNRVVYRSDQETALVFELFSVPIDGPAASAVKISGSMTTGGIVQNDIEISPDSSRVVYNADQDTNGTYEIYSVPITGPAASGVKLNKSLVSGGVVHFPSIVISTDSSRVLYLADQDTETVDELYSVPIAGPASSGVKLNNTPVNEGDVGPGFDISDDNLYVIYKGDLDTTNTTEIYRVPLAGPASNSVKLNKTFVSGGSLAKSAFQISPDNDYVIYLADQDTDGVNELYSVPITGPASSGVKISGTLTSGGSVTRYALEYFPAGF
jgi:hypothetical protein